MCDRMVLLTFGDEKLREEMKKRMWFVVVD